MGHPILLRRVAAEEHLTDRAFCGNILSLCALSSARLRETGMASIHTPTLQLSPPTFAPEETPEEFLQAAQQTVSVALTATVQFDDMRAAGLLSVAAVDFGRFGDLRYWIGAYLMLATVEGLHFEEQWPSGLTPIEREERRRLVWLIYQHDVYTSVIVGATIKHREAQIHVKYPAELTDEALESRVDDVQVVDNTVWVHAWNKVTDIYRILEHAIDQTRNAQRSAHHSLATATLNGKLSQEAYTSLIYELEASLPSWCFDFTLSPSGDLNEQIKHFQTLNVLSTLQNARIVALCTKDGFTTAEGVEVAQNLLRSLSQVPQSLLRGMGMPLFYQLVGIGTVLTHGTDTSTVSYATLVEVRASLQEMSIFCQKLDTPNSHISKATRILQQLISNLDVVMPSPAPALPPPLETNEVGVDDDLVPASSNEVVEDPLLFTLDFDVFGGMWSSDVGAFDTLSTPVQSPTSSSRSPFFSPAPAVAPLLIGQVKNALRPGVKNILITGGAGFIGSWVSRHLVVQYPEYNIVVFDKLDYCATLNNLAPVSSYKNFTFHHGDITSPESITAALGKYEIDTVMHFAAQSHVDLSFGNSYTFTYANVFGTHVLLEAAKAHNIKLFIHVSTDEVYGEVPHDAADLLETAILSPTNPYAASKAAAEMLVNAYYKSFKLPVIIVRSNNVYGPHQYPEKIIPKFSTLLHRGQKLIIHGDGTPTRRYLYGGDAADAFDFVLAKGEVGQIYNVGSEAEIMNIDLCKLLLKEFGKEPKTDKELNEEIVFVRDRPFNDHRYAVDGSKLKSLGWTQNTPFATGLSETVKWYREWSESWWGTVDSALTAFPVSVQNKQGTAELRSA
ncbi:Trifunctional UDP-glucose 4,6-dehydratase/UDP-4-keto-6-deoxy-D-glucose 3,5-epimerase/UDP-4-keto-L-rhamnose-reductase RHM3 [Pseudohyphozyma bogoriensis]|nr:Trifunctional UDP-glucose 4,6-dehydratase/UDP-4-keto-6-deoxy-D-glucose 3,5-epimerase/UDP-4-keto-L-rhamnose-reductase RHM3 [Pseudohyphozyma bogoriensis]